MFDCKVCTNNQFCKYTEKAEIFKRLVGDLDKSYDIADPFSMDPQCEHFNNAFEGVPREIAE